MFGSRRRNAVALLYALRKKERYEAKGFHAFVHNGVFPSDGLWEVYVFPKGRTCPTCQRGGWR